MNDADIDSLPAGALALLQRGMAQHRSDPVGAEFLFGIARSQAPASLPLYRALVKFYNRECQFDAAYDMAALGMREAARLGQLPPDWRDWSLDMLSGKEASFALLTLKAMAFLELRRGNTPASVEILQQLQRLDPGDGVGSSVVAALAAGIQAGTFRREATPAHWKTMNAEQEISQLKDRIAQVYAQRERLKQALETGALAPHAGFQQLDETDRLLSRLDSRYKNLLDAAPGPDTREEPTP